MSDVQRSAPAGSAELDDRKGGNMKREPGIAKQGVRDFGTGPSKGRRLPMPPKQSRFRFDCRHITDADGVCLKCGDAIPEALPWYY